MCPSSFSKSVSNRPNISSSAGPSAAKCLRANASNAAASPSVFAPEARHLPEAPAEPRAAAPHRAQRPCRARAPHRGRRPGGCDAGEPRGPPERCRLHWSPARGAWRAAACETCGRQYMFRDGRCAAKPHSQVDGCSVTGVIGSGARGDAARVCAAPRPRRRADAAPGASRASPGRPSRRGSACSSTMARPTRRGPSPRPPPRATRACACSPPDLGLVGALNAGLAACRGPLVARMDGDDLMHRERLARQLDALERRPDAGGRRDATCGSLRAERSPSGDASTKRG
jgi:hypothetical protein